MTRREYSDAWELVCSIFGFKPITAKEKKRVGALARDFAAKGATERSIRETIKRHRQTWPAIMATVDSVLKHWDELNVPGWKAPFRPGQEVEVDTEGLARCKALDKLPFDQRMQEVLRIRREKGIL